MEAPCSAKQFHDKRGQKKSAPSEEGADSKTRKENPILWVLSMLIIAIHS